MHVTMNQKTSQGNEEDSRMLWHLKDSLELCPVRRDMEDFTDSDWVMGEWNAMVSSNMNNGTCPPPLTAFARLRRGQEYLKSFAAAEAYAKQAVERRDENLSRVCSLSHHRREDARMSLNQDQGKSQRKRSRTRTQVSHWPF
jgi:hypothetical protein